MKKTIYNKLQNRQLGGKELQFRAVKGKNGERILEGYAALFNVRSKLLFNSFYEVLERGSFDNLLKRKDLDVVFNFNHNNSIVMGRTTNGTLKLSADEKGLYFRAVLPNTTDADNLYELVKRGDISQNSFAFLPAKNGYTMKRMKDSEYDLVTISEIDQLRDVSAVTFPAYEQTSISARALDEEGKPIPEEEEEEVPTEEVEEEEEEVRIVEIDEKKLVAIEDIVKELVSLVDEVHPTEEVEPIEGEEEERVIDVDEKKLIVIEDLVKDLVALVEEVHPTEEERVEDDEEEVKEDEPVEDEEDEEEERSLNLNKRIFLKIN